MQRQIFIVLLALASVPTASTSFAQEQAASYDYFRPQRDMIQAGVQAVLMCNGLFTSNRSLKQVFDQELAYLQNPIGSARGGDYEVDTGRQAVAVGAAGGTPVMRAVFREGLGCVIMAPDQTFDDIDGLPLYDRAPPAGDSSTIPWPNGDLIPEVKLPSKVDAAALKAASDWAFDRANAQPAPSNPEQQVTLSLLVVLDGQIIHERYAPGIDATTRTRTWSTAKSIGATLFGILVDRGQLALDEPLGIDWLPKIQAEDSQNPPADPRSEITLRHVLNMSSGLYPVDSWGMEYATGSGLSYWAGASSVDGARSRSLLREPGTYWDYENYDTLLATYAMKQALGDPGTYLEFPRTALLDRIGMRNTLLSVDRFGDFILSSQVYTNARDLARFGLLYQQGGVWDGERLISEEWIDFVRQPAPATEARGNMYGGQFWLVPDARNDVPKDAYSTAGNRGQYVIVVPSHDLVIVRRGLDFGRQGFSNWDLTREVLKAFRD